MNRRRFLQVAGASAPLFGAAMANAAGPSAVQRSAIAPALKATLDEQIARYMQQNNAPGMQFALVDLRGTEYLASYGFEDLRTRKPLTPDRLFQIGSISKSMAAIAVLQLVEEGKLDLQRPVLDTLPFLPWSTPLGSVTLQHVLTHTTGLPGDGSLYFPGNFWTHRQRYAPGERYFYSNMAFNTLGLLVSTVDGRSYQESLTSRVLHPAGMNGTVPSLGGAEWARQATSYVPASVDVPFHRFDALREAPPFHEDTSAGCVASTPLDMACYLRCLLRGGVADSGARILSPASFKSMTTSHVKANEWGPHAGYGFGIGVDHQSEDTILMHTGGMVSFMSAIYLNLTRGIAAFASINAQQGYRPMPVVRYAVEALAAEGTSSPPASIAAPAPETSPKANDAGPVTRPDLVGTFVNDDPWQGTCRVEERAGKLTLNGTPLQSTGDGSYWVESEPGAPDRAAFVCVAGGQAQILLVNGTPFRRWHAPPIS
ncbi:serine hydrolase domain-containing protein [Terriglobus aquaticus]|uniref:Serine hydrolase domain-containing protein n=1 Tax=Terriglobus aquaticus TaxID=940139 RepID=A0ABW9KJF4_9BACT|nr:serine hydrolase domain-containing protein [Terriglobus aquaticus]